MSTADSSFFGTKLISFLFGGKWEHGNEIRLS